MVLLSVMACVSLMLSQEIPEQTISIDTIIEASPDTVQLDQIIQHQVPASLDPEPFGQEKLGVKELKAWYKRVGFKPDPAYGGEWRRYPK